MMIDRILNKLGRIFRTDIRYILKGGFWLSGSQVIATFSSFILAIAFARLAPKELYGYYKFILSIAGILTAFSLSGIGLALTQSVARGYDNSLGLAFTTSLKWSLGMIVVALCGAIYYGLHANYILGFSLILIAIFTPLINSFSLFDSFLVGKKDFKRTTIYGTLDTLIPMLALTAVLFLKPTVAAVLTTYFVSNAAAAALFYYLTKKQKTNDLVDSSFQKYGLHVSIMNVLVVIADNIDQLVVFHFLGPIQLAVFSYAIAMPEQIKGIFKSVFSLALPRFSQRDPELIQKSMYQKMAIFASAVIVAIILYIIIAPYLFQFLFPQYIDSVYYSRLFSVSLVAITTLLPLSLLHSQKKTNELYIYNISISCIQIIGSCLLTYYFGIIGAIVARIISRFFGLGLLLIIR